MKVCDEGGGQWEGKGESGRKWEKCGNGERRWVVERGENKRQGESVNRYERGGKRRKKEESGERKEGKYWR